MDNVCLRDLGFSADLQEDEKTLFQNLYRDAKRVLHKRIDDSHFCIYIEVDEHISVCLYVDDSTKSMLGFNCHYDTGVPMLLENCSWINRADVSNNFVDGIVNCRITDSAGADLNVLMAMGPCERKRFGKNSKYQCSIACLAVNFRKFDSAQECNLELKKYGNNVAIDGFAMPSVFLKNYPNKANDPIEPDPMISIIGTVAMVEKRVNDYTKKSFYFATVIAMGTSYDLLIAEDLVDGKLEKGDVIHGHFIVSGKDLKLLKQVPVDNEFSEYKFSNVHNEEAAVNVKEKDELVDVLRLIETQKEAACSEGKVVVNVGEKAEKMKAGEKDEVQPPKILLIIMYILVAVGFYNVCKFLVKLFS